MNNRYFILPKPNNNSSLWDIVVQNGNTVRTNIQGNKMIVKLHLNDLANHSILNGIKEYTLSELKEYINDVSNGWINE